MTPHNASTAARELVKAYLEHQELPKYGGDGAEYGSTIAEAIIAMHKKLTEHFQRID